jgi:hypothetical protein
MLARSKQSCLRMFLIRAVLIATSICVGAEMIALRHRGTRFNDFFSPWVGCIAPRCED